MYETDNERFSRRSCQSYNMRKRPVVIRPKTSVAIAFLVAFHLNIQKDCTSFAFHPSSYTTVFHRRRCNRCPKNSVFTNLCSSSATSKPTKCCMSLFGPAEEPTRHQPGPKRQPKSQRNVDQQGRNEGRDEEEEEGENFFWENGNVYEDFQNLEQAINFAQADNFLKATERSEMLDEFAAQRRLLLPDVHRFITRTLRISALFVISKQWLLAKARMSPSSPIYQLVQQAMVVPFDAHFWIMVVAVPAIFLNVKQLFAPKAAPKPRDIDKLDEYQRYVRSDWWENPETSCRDYVLCLLEQWNSAINGFIWFTALRLGFAGVMRLPSFPIDPVPIYSDSILAITQFIARLGATVSLFQFPELLYQLRRRQQPRPVKLDATIMQNLLKNVFKWGIPFGMASDISKLLVRFSPKAIAVFYGTMLTALSALNMRYHQERKPKRSTIPSKKEKKRQKQIRKMIVYPLSVVAVIKYIQIVTAFLWRWYITEKFPTVPWPSFCTASVFILALLG